MTKFMLSDRTALIAYGSETGTAQDYAEELGRALERVHFQTNVTCLDRVGVSIMNNVQLVFIVTSTTGQGELPNNARQFFKTILRKRLPDDLLENCKFTSFGLGDSSYPKFNWAVRKLHKRLLQLGAAEIYQRGEADEQHAEGLDATFLPWLVSLRQELLQMFPLPPGLELIPDNQLLSPRSLLSLDRDHKACNGNDDLGTHTRAISIDSHMEVSLVENRRMTPDDHWQDVRHLKFQSGRSVSYAAGDVLTIYPENMDQDVEQFIKLMDWSSTADLTLHLHDAAAGQLPCPATELSADMGPGPQSTLRDLLKYHLDITAIPRRSFFGYIAHFTTDESHRDRLLEFNSPQYIDELYDYTTRPRRSILEVLYEFDSVKIPWQWAACVLPRLKGRQFSIASGGPLKYGPNGTTNFELLVAIVKYKTIMKKIREGVCTKFLAALQPGRRLRVSLRQGGLAVDEGEVHRPVILIGPGTGLAPMRAMIWERSALAQDHSNSMQTHSKTNVQDRKEIGQTMLFFGCRSRQADNFYHDEWSILQDQMVLDVHTAFSRDQKAKVYVQDVLRQHGAEVYRLLHDMDGILYVCGSSGMMPKAVREALVDIYADNATAMGRDDALVEIAQLEKAGRYKQETW